MRASREWLWKRNCSLTPRQFVHAYVLLFAASLVVALTCALSMMLHPHYGGHGAWLLPLFALLELAAVAAAFLYHARHATDREHLALLGNRLLVERIEAERIEQIWMDACRTRVQAPSTWGELIRLEGGGVAVEVGRHVPPSHRRELAQELREGLRTAALVR
ncbi:DUF2244 domain-containing protein [Noviherbaspirillum pedocola]|uniref:DUF2244 domain-containing protein n=1 Tax=Noviherbaspirillum pedocola TaxID=2801341 RepID=A0A934T3C8_9BURK|nr:DUF2244 domain-containing protein [Noviherbaspirillum pedocola]MBK4739127.1 DUF2244 domain-containing protein [Noviherbaspirillum pedocola]